MKAIFEEAWKRSWSFPILFFSCLVFLDLSIQPGVHGHGMDPAVKDVEAERKLGRGPVTWTVELTINAVDQQHSHDAATRMNAVRIRSLILRTKINYSYTTLLW